MIALIVLIGSLQFASLDREVGTDRSVDVLKERARFLKIPGSAETGEVRERVKSQPVELSGTQESGSQLKTLQLPLTSRPLRNDMPRRRMVYHKGDSSLTLNSSSLANSRSSARTLIGIGPRNNQDLAKLLNKELIFAQKYYASDIILPNTSRLQIFQRLIPVSGQQDPMDKPLDAPELAEVTIVGGHGEHQDLDVKVQSEPESVDYLSTSSRFIKIIQNFKAADAVNQSYNHVIYMKSMSDSDSDQDIAKYMEGIMNVIANNKIQIQSGDSPWSPFDKYWKFEDGANEVAKYVGRVERSTEFAKVGGTDWDPKIISGSFSRIGVAGRPIDILVYPVGKESLGLDMTAYGKMYSLEVPLRGFDSHLIAIEKAFTNVVTSDAVSKYLTLAKAADIINAFIKKICSPQFLNTVVSQLEGNLFTNIVNGTEPEGACLFDKMKISLLGSRLASIQYVQVKLEYPEFFSGDFMLAPDLSAFKERIEALLGNIYTRLSKNIKDDASAILDTPMSLGKITDIIKDIASTIPSLGLLETALSPGAVAEFLSAKRGVRIRISEVLIKDNVYYSIQYSCKPMNLAKVETGSGISKEIFIPSINSFDQEDRIREETMSFLNGIEEKKGEANLAKKIENPT